MKQNEHASKPLPSWLTEKSGSPFHDHTREALRTRAQTHPELVELIERLQEKGPAEGSREWEWAQNFCRRGIRTMQELHKNFTPADELDVLKLAAHLSDHSYSDFFIQYSYALKQGTLSYDERRQYSETIRAITPVVMEAQPAVAVGFAPQIHSAHRQFDIHPMVEDAFEAFAREHPRRVLAQPDRFSEFRNRDAIMQAAEEARAATTPRTTLEEAQERNLQGRAKIAQDLGITFTR